MAFPVIQLGRSVHLVRDQETYLCLRCGKRVQLGDSGKAISLAEGSFEFEHYSGEGEPEDA